MNRTTTAVLSLLTIGYLSLSAHAEFGLKQMVFADNYMAPQQRGRTRCVKLIKRADYVSTTISLTTTKKSKDTPLADLKNDLDLLKTAIAANKKFSTYSGPMRFGSHGKSYGNAAQSRIVVLAKLGADGYEDALTAGNELRQFYADIKKDLKTESSIEETSLALNDPEQYRGEILKKLAADIQQTKNSFNGKAKVTISGLNSPVDVSPLDDAHLELSVDYDLRLEIVD